MVGFRTKDNAVFLADCLASKETLEKYQISFLVDVKSYLETLETVKAMEVAIFIPSHAQASADIKDLAQYNIDNANQELEIVDRFMISVC